MKYYEIIETLNAIDDRAIQSALYGREDNINIAYYDNFINDHMINCEIIKYLVGEYYLAVQFISNKDYIRRFIEKNYTNDNKLYAAFSQSNDFSKGIIANYINHSIKFERSKNILKLKEDNKLDIGLSLNPYMLSENQFQYLTDQYNYCCKNFTMNVMKLTQFNPKYGLLIRNHLTLFPDLFFHCLFGNAYKVSIIKKLCQTNRGKDITDMMQNKNYNDIKKLFLKDNEFLMAICFNAFEYYCLPNDVLEKMNLIILKNSEFKKKLNEFDPLYVVSMIADFDRSKRQKRKIK